MVSSVNSKEPSKSYITANHSWTSTVYEKWLKIKRICDHILNRKKTQNVSHRKKGSSFISAAEYMALKS